LKQEANSDNDEKEDVTAQGEEIEAEGKRVKVEHVESDEYEIFDCFMQIPIQKTDSFEYRPLEPKFDSPEDDDRLFQI
jgi:hypothetical protein